MKKHILTAILLVSFYPLFSQQKFINTAVNNKLEFSVAPKVGFARLEQTGYVTLNGFLDGADVLLSFGLKKGLNISTGISYWDVYGNRTNSNTASNIQNSCLQIPLDLNLNLAFGQKNNSCQPVALFVGVGFVGNDYLNQKVETVETTTNSRNLGWGLGFRSHFGLKVPFQNNISVGMGIENYSDLTKVKKDDVSYTINASSIYVSLGIAIHSKHEKA